MTIPIQYLMSSGKFTKNDPRCNKKGRPRLTHEQRLISQAKEREYQRNYQRTYKRMTKGIMTKQEIHDSKRPCFRVA